MIKMELTIHRSILVLFILVRWFSCAPQNCVDVGSKNGFLSVSCKNISSLNEIVAEAQQNWATVIVENQPNVEFQILDSDTNQLDRVVTLDLSRSGKLIISDNGFRHFTSLKKIVLSQTKLSYVKSLWFGVNNGLQILDIRNNRLRTLTPENVQHFKMVYYADFSSNRLESIAKKTFAEMLSLKELHLGFNKLKVINFGEAPKVTKLVLTNNEISKIASYEFEDMPSIQILDLRSNSVEVIEDSAFAGLDNLWNLNLGYNQLQSIQQKTFAGLSYANIDLLTLKHNNIREIAAFSFQNLGLLKKLDFTGNAITQVDDKTFVGLKSVTSLWLTRNQISFIGDNSFSGLQSLEELILTENHLPTLNENMFGTTVPNLKRIWYMYNALVDVNPRVFESTPNLEELYLAHNRITHLKDDTFVPLRRLKGLFLDDNSIEELTTPVMNSLEFLEDFAININRISFLPNMNHTFPRLKKALIEANPWQCHCLNEVLKLLDMRNVFFPKNEYFDGKKAACVVAPYGHCVKDIEIVRKEKLVEKYFNVD